MGVVGMDVVSVSVHVVVQYDGSVRVWWCVNVILWVRVSELVWV